MDVIGYDPTGIGYKGLGVVTGYTAEEVDVIPNLPAADLLAYLDQTIADLRDAILAHPPGGLSASVPGIGAPRSVYAAVKPILTLADFSGKKLRVNATAMEREKMRRLGATAVPLPLTRPSTIRTTRASTLTGMIRHPPATPATPTALWGAPGGI